MSDYKELSLEKSCLVDFLTHKAFIQEKLLEGYSRHSVWKGLYDAKMINVTYSYFLRLCRAQFPERAQAASRKTARFPKGPDNTPAEALNSNLQPPAPASETLSGKDGSYMLGGFKMDPNRPKRASLDMPKPFEWNPIPLTKEEILTGKITSR